MLVFVGLGNAFGNLVDRLVLHLGQQVQVFGNDLDLPGTRLSGFTDRVTPTQKVASLAADGQHINVLVLEIADELRRSLQHVGVERACESAIPGDEHQ